MIYCTYGVLRYTKAMIHQINTISSAVGAEKFFVAASAKICLSILREDTARCQTLQLKTLYMAVLFAPAVNLIAERRFVRLVVWADRACSDVASLDGIQDYGAVDLNGTLVQIA